jgi:glucose-6-phosphate 1-dehydrogenase
VLHQATPLDPALTTRGQYVGYLDEPGVAGTSGTETYVSTTLYIDSWRWAGVPFHIRTGKAMTGTATEAVIEFRRPPRMLFTTDGHVEPAANLLRFRLGHHDGVTISVQAKSPGSATVSQPVDLAVDFATALGPRQPPYERLLDDVLDGRRHRFARADIIDQEWRIVGPILDPPERPIPYYQRTWGPADGGPSGGWHDIAFLAQ